MYTSKSTRGFYDSTIHGPLTVVVSDPNWTPPKITITLAPGESYQLSDTVATNNGTEPMTLTVPDPDAVAPLQEVENPDTLIPPDAVEITVKEWQALLDGQALGQLIEWGEDGFPFLTDPPPPPPPTIEQTEAARLQAYANPLTGSDRHFAEAARCNTQGDTAGAQAATTAGQARYEEIRTEYPWPVDPAATKSKAKK